MAREASPRWQCSPWGPYWLQDVRREEAGLKCFSSAGPKRNHSLTKAGEVWFPLSSGPALC